MWGYRAEQTRKNRRQQHISDIAMANASASYMAAKLLVLLLQPVLATSLRLPVTSSCLHIIVIDAGRAACRCPSDLESVSACCADLVVSARVQSP